MATKAGMCFTLANLVAVILIVGSEAIVVFPRINDLIKNHRLNNVAQEVWQDMHRARLLAIKDKGTIRIEFDHDSYKVVRAATGEVAFKRNLSIEDRKSTRLNSSHSQISYAVFCLKKKKKQKQKARHVSQ